MLFFKNKTTSIVVALLFSGAFFILGFFAGNAKSVKDEVTADNGSIDIKKVVDLYGRSRSDKVSFEQFWNVWNMVKSNYVEQPVDETKLFYGAIKGMVAGLDDPYSVYLPPKKAEEFAADLAGEFSGIGAEIGMKDEQLIVIAPLPSSPAEKAGLKPKDRIFKIDEKETQGLTVEEAVGKIRGPEGTQVKLTIASDGEDKIREITLTRQKINIPTVTFEKKANNIAYIRISHFNDETVTEFDSAVNKTLEMKPKGIILDMRSNPGGYLDASVDVASEWVKEGVVVKERFYDGKVRDYETTGKHRLAGIPTIVLVDAGTASGAEIVAGALQDYGFATLVGEKTFGKGSVQNLEVLGDGSALKLTVAKWFTPKDRQITGQGIPVDVEMKEMFVKNEKPKADEPQFTDKGVEKAIELLNK